MPEDASEEFWDLARKGVDELDVFATYVEEIREEGELPGFFGMAVLGLHAACLAHVRGIVVLLRAGLLSEAAIIYRSLLEDSLALMYIAQDADRREERALEWVLSSIKEEIAYERSRVGDADSEGVQRLRREESELRDLADASGVRLRKFPDASALANRTEQRELKKDYSMASKFTHTTRRSLAHRGGQDPAEPGRVTLEDRTDPRGILELVARAVATLGAASRSTAAILDWDSHEALSSRENEAHTLLRRLAEQSGFRLYLTSGST